MFDRRYEAQVRLLLRCLPEVSRQDCFALKGGLVSIDEKNRL